MAEQNYVELRHVNKKYKDFQASDDINFGIGKGKLIGLLGPSGSGKTTILRMLAGLEHADSGEIIIDGRVVNDVPASERGIGFVFQNYALFRYMTVYDNIAFGLDVKKWKKADIRRRVDELVELVGLKGFEKRYPNQLSGGQRQRVALGRAIVKNQKVFLMDEPLSNLDAKLRVSMRTEISRLHREMGATTIYVTHDQVEAMTMADRIVIMKEGVIQQVGKPMELYDHPVNKFVAGFIGSPQMNFLDAVISEKGGNVIATIGGEHEVIVPAAKAKVLKDKGYVGKKVVLGIRPEDIHDSQMFLETSPSKPMNSVVKVYELLGAEVFLYFDVNGTQVTARVDPRTNSKTGDTIKFAFDMEKSHFFDKETELTICN